MSVSAICLMSAGSARAGGLNSGIELYNAGKYGQALPVLEAAVRANPYDPATHYYLGLCYQGLKQVSLARQHFQWVAANSRDQTLRAYAEKALGSYVPPKASGSLSVSASTPVASASVATATAGEARAKQLGRCKVLMFETSWCHYCHEFAPQFDEAASKYGSMMDFQHVDAEDPGNGDMKQKYGIKSYPRLVYLDGKGNVLYNEGRGAFAERLKELTGK